MWDNVDSYGRSREAIDVIIIWHRKDAIFLHIIQIHNGKHGTCLAFELNILLITKIHELSLFNKHFEYLRILKTSDNDVNIKLIYSLYCICNNDVFIIPY